MVFWDMFCTNVAGVAISTFFLLLASRLLFGRRLHQFRIRSWKISKLNSPDWEKSKEKLLASSSIIWKKTAETQLTEKLSP